MELFDSLRFKIVRRGIKIVFPEATDARILGAAARLKAEELVEPILVLLLNVEMERHPKNKQKRF